MKRPIKKAQRGTKELPIPRHDLSGRDGVWATGVQISDKDFKKHRKDFEYLDTPKPKPMKKLDKNKPLFPKKPVAKKPSMKKGGTVKKAFLGNVLGAATGLLGGGAGGGLLGGLLGGGGAKGGAGGAGGGMSKISKMFGGSMKKGGKVAKKAKTGTSLGMKSVKAGFDKNPGVTRADIITAATKKARSGTSVKKAQSGDSIKKPSVRMTSTKNYDVKETTYPGGDKETTTKFNPRGGAKFNIPPITKKKAKSGTTVKKCRYGCK